MQLIFQLIPEKDILEAGSDYLIQNFFIFCAMHSGTECDIVVYREWEGIRTLEYHAYFLAQNNEIGLMVQYVVTLYEDLAGYIYAFNEVIHPVEDPKERRFTAARRAYHGGYHPCLDRKVDVYQGVKIAIREVQFLYFYLHHYINQTFLLYSLTSWCLRGL